MRRFLLVLGLGLALVSGGSYVYAGGDAQEVSDVTERWDDLRFPATRIRQGATQKPDFDVTNIGLLFPQNDTAEIAYLIAQMPHDKKLASNLRPHIHYIQTETNDPVFKIDYRTYDNGDDIAALGFTTITQSGIVFATWDTGDELLQIATFPEIDMSGEDGVSAFVDIRVYRDDNVVTGDVLMKEFDFHYLSNSRGSRQEYVQ